MKRKNLISLIATSAISLIFILLTTESQTKIAQPPTIQTGAPSETTCGKSGCHNTAPNSFSGTLSITCNQSFYTPDSTYVFTITTSETGMTRFGFEATLLDASNIKRGVWAIINTTTTTLQTATNNRSYVGHKTANSTNSWSFEWTAPSTNVGDVTIYVASICADNNNSSGGDHCYTNSLVLQPQMSSVKAILNSENNFQLIQNPVIDKIIVSYNNSIKGKSLIRLLDLNGRVVKILLNEEQNTGSQTSTFLAPETSGLYLIDYSNGNNHTVKKVIVL